MEEELIYEVEKDEQRGVLPHSPAELPASCWELDYHKNRERLWATWGDFCDPLTEGGNMAQAHVA